MTVIPVHNNLKIISQISNKNTSLNVRKQVKRDAFARIGRRQSVYLPVLASVHGLAGIKSVFQMTEPPPAEAAQNYTRLI